MRRKKSSSQDGQKSWTNWLFSVRQTFGARAGSLEKAMLEEVWKRGSVTVRELVDEGKTDLAYTTLMTTLERLHKKGFLRREPAGKAFRYFPFCDRKAFPRHLAITHVRRCVAAFENASLLLSYFVDAVAIQDAHLLEELSDLIERKKRELNRKHMPKSALADGM
ncbi:MAG TPA: BlaI/MecI/CopY family transcriptional regulator [Terriglobales bacterium]